MTLTMTQMQTQSDGLLSPQEIGAEYKRRYAELQKSLGKTHLEFAETVALHEWYKSEHGKHMNIRKAAEEKEKKDRERAEKAGVEYVPDKPVIVGYIICRDCNAEFPKPTTRGRPPVRCEECRSK